MRDAGFGEVRNAKGRMYWERMTAGGDATNRAATSRRAAVLVADPDGNLVQVSAPGNDYQG